MSRNSDSGENDGLNDRFHNALPPKFVLYYQEDARLSGGTSRSLIATRAVGHIWIPALMHLNSLTYLACVKKAAQLQDRVSPSPVDTLQHKYPWGIRTRWGESVVFGYTKVLNGQTKIVCEVSPCIMVYMY